jgi:hypothetical protein
MAAPADKGVNWIAIKAIDLFRGGAGFRGAFRRCGNQQFPLGR